MNRAHVPHKTYSGLNQPQGKRIRNAFAIYDLRYGEFGGYAANLANEKAF